MPAEIDSATQRTLSARPCGSIAACTRAASAATGAPKCASATWAPSATSRTSGHAAAPPTIAITRPRREPHAVEQQPFPGQETPVLHEAIAAGGRDGRAARAAGAQHREQREHAQDDERVTPRGDGRSAHGRLASP